MKKTFVASLFLAAGAFAAAVTPFGHQEKIGFYGDSISHNGYFVVDSHLMWLLRHPGAQTRVDNVGKSGDTATGALARWEWDAKAYGCDRYFVMLGMNDVSRGLWSTVEPRDADEAKRREEAIARYRTKMRELVERLLAERRKVVLVTPSPYDSYSPGSGEVLLGCNEPGLARCAEICRELAREKGLELVDFHAPLTRLLREHPEGRFLGDRVHPQWRGGLAMAALVMEAMGQTNELANVVFDAEGKDRFHKWYPAPRALPLPVDDDYRFLAKVWPRVSRLNREMLMVRNLPRGRYQVREVARVLGTFSSDELARGVNLAELDTQNQAIARKARRLVQRLQKLLNDYRSVRLDCRQAGDGGFNLDDPAQFEKFVEQTLKRSENKPWHAYDVSRMKNLRAFRPKLKEHLAEIESIYAELRTFKTKGYNLHLVRVPAGVAGDWQVWAHDREFAVEPPPLNKVVGERHESLPEKPAGGWKCGGWLRGARLAALVAGECSVNGALVPESVTVKSADGTVLVEGKDYEVEREWAAISRLAGGRLAADTPVLVDYAYRAQRLDRIVRTAAGTLDYRAGVPAATGPKLPALAAGESAFASIWVDGRTRRLSSRNVYAVREKSFPDAPAWGDSVAARLMPKTLAKLERGEPVRILAWGDSVTEAGYLPEEGRWQNQFVRRLRAKFPKSDITLVVNGWGGRSSRSFKDEKLAPPGSAHNWRERVVGVKADLVVLEFVNDVGAYTKYNDLAAHYDRIRSEITAAGGELCCLTPHYVRGDWMGLGDPTATAVDPRPYVRHLRNWCEARDVACADASLRWGRLALQGIPYQTLLVNEINHPDAFGMSLFADALMDLFRGGEGPGPMYKGRKLVWGDEFDGNTLDSTKWNFRRSMYSHDCVYSNDARTARVENGMLHLQVHKSGRQDKKFMLSEGISTHEEMNYSHGYLEIRARMPFRHGAWPSFWMTSAERFRSVPWLCEIDVFEVFSNPDTVVANLHKWGGEHVMLPGGEGYPARGFKLNAATINDEFHVYGFEWNWRELIFYVDGKAYYRCPVDEARDFSPDFIGGASGFHDPQGILFNNEIFTPGHGWCPKGFELTSDDPFPIDYWIDWVRLWQDPACERIERLAPKP